LTILLLESFCSITIKPCGAAKATLLLIGKGPFKTDGFGRNAPAKEDENERHENRRGYK
jgi:hypothetical protein